MNNPIELRGSQAMVNEIDKDKSNFKTIFKWLLVLSALGFVIHFPDVIGHFIVWMVHTFYEATSFILEEFLKHSFGLDKDLAQFIVFYFSVVVGITTTVLFWRYCLRDYLALKFYSYKSQVIEYWHTKKPVDKIKLILIHSALVISAFMLLIS